MNAIAGFRGPYRFLSNFYVCGIAWNGKHYETVEHAFQAAKATTDVEHEMVRQASSAARAKQLGKSVKCRPDWDTVKRSIMLELLQIKFSHPDLAKKLLATGDDELIEDNWWGDEYWGVCNGRGANWLGKLLMDVRDRLRGTI